MAKIDTRFMTKRAEKPYPTYLYSPYKGGPPPPRASRSQFNICGFGSLFLHHVVLHLQQSVVYVQYRLRILGLHCHAIKKKK